MGKLERKYAEELVVIGVHSPKYTAEEAAGNVRQAVERSGIQHPVVSDPEHRVWDAYAVRAWPTLIFISPTGEVIGSHAGEAPFEALDRVLTKMVEEYDRFGSLVRGTPPATSWQPRPLDQLWYPGKVLATREGVFIADSGHHRVLLTDHDGTVNTVAGDGAPDLVDGSFNSARFNHPQGMALDQRRQCLYVADAENHVIRALDLRTRAVSTVAGTGEQATRRVRSGVARQTALSSPWDLALDGSTLFIAMAGLHQIWTLDLVQETVQVWAGTGHEDWRDGPRETAWLAQPMGLSLAAGQLYVACAEAQAVRRIDLASGLATTLVGAGLFDFGDIDGALSVARLQHVQDVTVGNEEVFVADTYNNQVKAIHLHDGEIVRYLGSGQTGLLDGPGPTARLAEPAGICCFENTLYIADTNNHAIRTADLESGHLRPFELRGLDRFVSGG